MKRPARFRQLVNGAALGKSSETLREQIPLRDMSDCLLAVYDEVSRRAFQRCIVRGAQEGSDREDWKAAEDDLFARISVDFEESGGNLYALASLPGCAGTELTVAVDECWLLIAGYGDASLQENAAEDFGDNLPAEYGTDCSSEENASADAVRGRAARELCADDEHRDSAAVQNDERHAKSRVPILRAPRPFCVVALRAKVDPGRSVAVLSNGLLAIRMGKAGLEAPEPSAEKLT
jgi:HSP20 family molecular chaperone IbpA